MTQHAANTLATALPGRTLESIKIRSQMFSTCWMLTTALLMFSVFAADAPAWMAASARLGIRELESGNQNQTGAHGAHERR